MSAEDLFRREPEVCRRAFTRRVLAEVDDRNQAAEQQALAHTGEIGGAIADVVEGVDDQYTSTGSGRLGLVRRCLYGAHVRQPLGGRPLGEVADHGRFDVHGETPSAAWPPWPAGC